MHQRLAEKLHGNGFWPDGIGPSISKIGTPSGVVSFLSLIDGNRGLRQNNFRISAAARFSLTVEKFPAHLTRSILMRAVANSVTDTGTA
jgi:hypothetical protein